MRARLTPVIKLSFIGPGRKIIKEGDPPSTVYFILSGEVEIYRRVYDRVGISDNYVILYLQFKKIKILIYVCILGHKCLRG